jgi:hypothetical protein
MVAVLKRWGQKAQDLGARVVLAARGEASPNSMLKLTALKVGGLARKGKGELALFGLGKRLLAAV